MPIKLCSGAKSEGLVVMACNPTHPENLREHAEFTAIINPKRTDDLKPSIEPFIGHRFRFKAMWIIERDETYSGDWACTIQDPSNKDIDWIWLPSRDLEDIEIISPGISA